MATGFQNTGYHVIKENGETIRKWRSRRYDKAPGVPARGSYHEEVPSRSSGGAVCSLLKRGTGLHGAGVHEARQLARVPAQRRRQTFTIW
ncbi:hypothetical protein LSTR_LSTR013172 [Laodelphax striatellus]|uniref:Uncharacterized protein n=1 Tax=Laodelphax striatellus TaxID=195883 RepID=A0A482WRT9_LAOST|nr:hypothetical protein LSTR_LSTR013172 [Laodelphax striatellus]